MTNRNFGDLTHGAATYTQIFEALPGAALLLEASIPQFTILAVTPTHLHNLGVTKDDIVGKGVFEAFPGNSMDLTDTGVSDLRDSFQHVLTKKEVHQLPVQRYDLSDKDGRFHERYWKAQSNPVMNDQGDVLYIIHTTQDITSEVKAAQREQQINGIEKAYQLFMQVPAIISVTKGADHVLELANEGAYRLWGKGPGIIGKPLVEGIPEVKGQGIVERFNTVYNSGTIVFESQMHLYR